MVCVINKYAYPDVHILSISPLYCFHKTNTFPNVIILDSLTTFQIYDLILCEISCDCDYIPLYCPRELKERKKNIKSSKIYKKKKKY